MYGSGGEDEEEDYGEPVTTAADTHPHRHHHGQSEQDDLNKGTIGGPELEPSEVFYQRPSTSLLLNYENIIATPSFVSF